MENTKQTRLLIGIAGCAVVVLILLIALFALIKPAPQTSETTAATTDTTAEATVEATVEATTQATTEATVECTTQDTTQPEPSDPQKEASGGAQVDVEQSVTDEDKQTARITLGIDVSRYQGTINWAQVADAGVDFAMIRIGYRTAADGAIIADTNAKYNLQEAAKHGIRLGAYFFSTAVTAAEAQEEATFVADLIAQYPITYPVAYNCEGFTDPDSRQYSLSKQQRTDLALAFLKAVEQRGYTGMFYASQNELETQWETSRLSSDYQIWVAQYPAVPYPETGASSYSGKHAMWQYTASGTVPGIHGAVDVNVAYFGYEDTAPPQNTDPAIDAAPDPEALMKFDPVSEAVTAKIETNLRDIPSQGSDATVLYTLKNGETALRTGISDSGWSRVEFEGKVYYAVSSYLTTDLDYQAPTQSPEPEIKTPFTPVSDTVTAKDVVNLRTLPSVTDPDSQVVAQLTHGEYIQRTGINEDVGWSRVEYNGQTLYCVSSYLTTEEASEQETLPA